MEFADVKKFLEDNKDNDEVSAYLNELSEVTTDKIQGYLESDEGKKLLQPKLDQYTTKGIESWKKNNLDAIVNEKINKEIKKRYPEKDEKDIALEAVKAELEQMRKETLKKELTNKAIKIASEKKIPTDIVDYFIGEDEDSTVENLSKLNNIFNQHIQKAVEEKLKDGSYTPPGSKNNQVDPDVLGFEKALGL